MSALLACSGLLLAIAGQPLLLWWLRRLGVDTLGMPARLSLWLLTGAVGLIAVQRPGWRHDAGLSAPTWGSLGLAALAVVLSFAGSAVLRLVQGSTSTAGMDTSAQFLKISALSLPQWIGLVVTAGVTEELLYRAFAIGLGRQLLGSTWLAVAVSLTAFTLGHVRWGLGHLLPVFWAGAVMSGLFVLSNDILACIGAHLLIDAIGVLVVPMLMKARYGERLDSSQPDTR